MTNEKISFRDIVLPEYRAQENFEGEVYQDRTTPSHLTVRITSPSGVLIMAKYDLLSDDIQENQAFTIRKETLPTYGDDHVKFEGEYSIIEFNGSVSFGDEEASDFFGSIIDVVIRSIYRSEAATIRTLSNMSKIFEKGISNKPITLNVILGLIGELAFIEIQEDTDRAIEAWHTDIYDAYDFDYGEIKFEIKATTKNVREHSFSDRQISQNKGEEVYIISIMVSTAASSGITIQELHREIYHRLSSEELADKLNAIIEETVGAPIEALPPIPFKVNSIKVYDLDSVPTPEYNANRISHLRWTAQLTEHQGIIFSDEIINTGFPQQISAIRAESTSEANEEEVNPPNFKATTDKGKASLEAAQRKHYKDTEVPISAKIKLDKKGRIPKSENKKLAEQMRKAGFETEGEAWELAKACKLPGFTYKP